MIEGILVAFACTVVAHAVVALVTGGASVTRNSGRAYGVVFLISWILNTLILVPVFRWIQ